MKLRLSRIFALVALVAGAAITTSALAQSATTAAPVRQFKDGNGVDLMTGQFTAMAPGVTIGDSENGLSFTREIRNTFQLDSMLGGISTSDGITYTVFIGEMSEGFTLSGGVFTPVEQNGSTLAVSGNTYTYRAGDGTVAVFLVPPTNYDFGNATGVSLDSITYPNGKKLTFYYTVASYQPVQGVNSYGRRLQSVTSNTGYHIKLTYEMDGVSSFTVGYWMNLIGVMALNDLVDSCSPSAYSCTASSPRPTLTINRLSGSGSSGRDYTDSAGNTTHYDMASDGISAIRLPGSSSASSTILYANSRVSSVTAFGVTTNYAYSDAGNIRTTTVTRGSNPSSIFKFDMSKLQVIEKDDELGRATRYEYDSSNRPTKVTMPEGNYVTYVYDARGNVTTTTTYPKPGSALSPIATTASYDPTCAIAVKCNKPNSTTDARGNITDYTYDGGHGGTLTVTGPAAPNGIRPQVRYSYTRLDVNGAVSASGVFRLTGISSCQTQSSCAGTADEAKSVQGYGQNQLLTSKTIGAGDNSLLATSIMTYDVVGNLLTLDGPLTGTADTTRYRYDANRRRIGVTSPAPGNGQPMRATRITFRPDGQVSKQETGTVADQSDAAWANFTPLQTVDIAFDTFYRPITRTLSAGGTVYALTQTSYDALGRVDCTAVRMTPATYGALPASACAQTSGNSDRIGEIIYDVAGEVTDSKQGIGVTGLTSTERHVTYNPNGTIASLTDANNHVTSSTYDGFDRPTRTTFPDASTEQVTVYDNNGNVLTAVNRAGQTVSYSYDALNRKVSKGGAAAGVNYGYDLLGRMLTITYAANGQGLSNVYDALSRLTSSTSNNGGTSRTMSYQYDLAGRRTMLTYPGGFYVNYDHLTTGEVSAIRENGATSGVGVLASYVYDALGNRTSLTRGNGAVTSYGFDPAARLTNLTNDVAGTASDLTKTFAYNPASAITSETRSNDAYAWNGALNVNRPYAANVLNQYTAAGAVSFTYDGNGNLAGDGTWTYGYDAESKLTSASRSGISATLAYDPLDRLYQLAGSGVVSMQFLYDGGQLAAEYIPGTGALNHRYVFGPGADEPLVEYDGSGNRHWFHADERGSIIAQTDSAGNASSIDAYDEYGIPSSSNVGRFGYTGQMYLYELGLSYYKARIYSPTLGRFMQADPIGYGDGMNVYAYAHNDPANGLDSTGLDDDGGGGCAGIGYATCAPPQPPISGPCQGGPFGGQNCNVVSNANITYFDNTGAAGNYYYNSSGQIYWQANGLSATDYAGLLGGGYHADPAAAAGFGDISAGHGRITFNVQGSIYTARTFTNPKFSGCASTLCGGAFIVLAYVGRDVGVRWIQSITVNGIQSMDSQSGSPPFYLSGDELAAFTRGTTVYFGDSPGRPMSGDWTWQAQTSAVIPNGSGGYTALATFSWGFTIQAGQVSLLPFTAVTPNSFQQGLIGSAH